ncbi:MAG: hypothetical protein SFV15_09300 [Polyangiaceae bacterium]|nr:hypothetical protein [Polyangiaceae bacterium]
MHISEFLPVLSELHAAIRSAVVKACESQSIEAVSAIADDSDVADTIFAIDKVSEELLHAMLEPHAKRLGGILLIAEGLPEAGLRLPHDQPEESLKWRVIVDPIDGTRGLMYQKRSAWVLTGVAPNRGKATTLLDIELAVQTEIPLVKQHLCDVFSAIRGQGVTATRLNRLTGVSVPLFVRPSKAHTIEQGYSALTRLFPGARDVLAAIDEDLVARVLGPAKASRAQCFEDQYASTAGQLHELLVGHDRFLADLRPLMDSVLASRGLPSAMYCHPYDICTSLIAEEGDVVVRAADGSQLDVPLDVTTPVAWAGYANATIQAQVEPALLQILRERQLIGV